MLDICFTCQLINIHSMSFISVRRQWTIPEREYVDTRQPGRNHIQHRKCTTRKFSKGYLRQVVIYLSTKTDQFLASDLSDY